MTHLGPVARKPRQHKPDPKRPYKAYASIASAMIMSLLAQAVITQNPYVVAVLTALAAGLACYMQSNPTE